MSEKYNGVEILPKGEHFDFYITIVAIPLMRE